ncbi:Mannose-1-phosphate guanylyltransferase RfbM [Anaerohalosphaera lusitana]|uniref:Mannose-1-phosphate guanylyltransferase RfbM n=1 Tax=Anaerohalosphaera lusitana TaxID=1936003 RepID=A0A1U9NLP1_9BACT|nr:sugar phosphate nucleotidyltransferase [Anaerohalosphaera lusitana]AQT68862.1 Mannose-1-phosphate guanylyltransferase RfbM [Anaerohalosphaera lusitana]
MDYAVIMAGGTGKRLWPLSRKSRPKQVLKLIEGNTLLRRCYDRLIPLFDPRNILVLTNAGYADIVRENLPDLPYGNVLAEPAVRDTAGAIGFAATVLSKYDPNARMAVVTADQLIEPTDVFQQALSDGLEYVKKNPDAMITFGIQPTFPSTQLGYIKVGEPHKCESCTNEIFDVDSFSEKPDIATSREYLSSGEYLWNSGMFIWQAKTILKNIEKYLPASKEPLKRIFAAWDGPRQEDVLKEWFIKMPKISIDYGVMEQAENVKAIRLNCSWRDMGSFSALADIISSDENNNIVVAGQSELIDSKNNILVTEDEDHLIAVIGLENMVVAHSPDATLVCPMDEAHRLKELLEVVKQHGGEKYL